jgi:glycosyltransferase involved in cell wall biosynthesis
MSQQSNLIQAGQNKLNAIVLTIGIPTYNCWPYLKENIDKALCEMSLLHAVEILICDNASTDGTYSGVQSYLRLYPHNLRYIRHSENLGMDANFWSVIENARGEYVHLLGDDDYYEKGAVKRILETLGSYDVDYCLLGNQWLNTTNGRLMPRSDGLGNGTYIKQSGAEILILDNLRSLTLSNIVIKRSACLGIPDVSQYFGCQWLHLVLFVNTLHNGSSAYIFSYHDPVVTVRLGNQRWLEQDGVIAYYLSAIKIFSQLSKRGFSNGVLRMVYARFLPYLSSGGRIKYRSFIANAFCLISLSQYFFRFPLSFLKLSLKLLLMPRKPFFEGLNKAGSE